MALGSRNFAESNTVMLMPLRSAILVLLNMVPPWVCQNPRNVCFLSRWRKKTQTRVTRYTMQGHAAPQHSARVSLLQAMILVRGRSNFVPKIAAVPAHVLTLPGERHANCVSKMLVGIVFFFFHPCYVVTK